MFSQLKLVVWKNLILRKRHMVLTAFESVLPILIFLLFAYYWNNGIKLPRTGAKYNDALPLTYEKLYEMHLYYTPQNIFYKQIIQMTRAKLGIDANNVEGFNSSQDLLQSFVRHYGNTAIIFNGNNRTKLDYIIRYDDESYSTTMDCRSSKYVESSPGCLAFLSVQKALDMSFIEKIYGKNLESSLDLFVEKFPSPPQRVGFILPSMTIYSYILPTITIVAFTFLYPSILNCVVEEKHSGIKEFLKMVGMKSWMLWLGWFIYAIIPVTISVIFIVIFMKVNVFSSVIPPLPFMDGSVLFVFLMLYGVAAIALSFAISSFFSRPSFATTAGFLIWYLSSPMFTSMYTNKYSWSVNILLSLLPNAALTCGYRVISSYEERELGVQWNNFFKSGSGDPDDLTMLAVFAMLIFDTVLYVTFTFYMDKVNPGKYGVKKNVFFPILALVKLVTRYIGKEQLPEEVPMDNLNNVEEGCGMQKGIEIENLCKRFGHKVVVNNLSFDIYQNQITVLLGHNGAGKSTLISMITGMLNANSGSIKLNGKDLKSNMDELRKSLGLCPQHNLLFTNFTVGEHLKFFAMLKGRSSEEAEEEIETLLDTLNLTEKRNAMAKTLSGGMKRKLCLGMAIIGGSNVLILDEPTSGMDPESRRELWDLLLTWREKKTILITTHFMEEADVLGDWISIMAGGALQCYGTPMFLKKKYGTGYHLSLMVSSNATLNDKQNIERYIKNYSGDVQFKEWNGNNAVFVLPFEDKMQIANLLTHLEAKKAELRVENISVTVTTLEDVFLKAGLEVENSTDDDNRTAIAAQNLWESYVTGTEIGTNRLWLRISALFIKKAQFFYKNMYMYLVIILLALVFFVLTIYINTSSSQDSPELKLKLDMLKETTVFYAGDHSALMRKIQKFYKQTVESQGSIPRAVKDVRKAIVNTGAENIVYYREYMVAGAIFHFNTTIEAVALYNTHPKHSAPISLNLVTNALAKAYLGASYSISISVWPLKIVNDENYSFVSQLILLWLLLLPIGFLFILGSFIMFPHAERSTKFLQLQYMCGVKPHVYWSVNFLTDFVVYLLFMTPMAILMCLSSTVYGSLEFGVIFVILFAFGVACIPVTYLFSWKKTAAGGFSLFIVLGMFLGTTLSVVLLYFDYGKIYKIFYFIMVPPVGLVHSGITFSEAAIRKYMKTCKVSNTPNTGNTQNCKEDWLPNYYLLLRENLALMLASGILYFLLNILLDSHLSKRCWSKLCYAVMKIWLEPARSPRLFSAERNENQNRLQAKHLQKSFSRKRVIKDISFAVNDGECLGILGVNGAGKTTTFGMLTRKIIADKGAVEMIDNGRHISIDEDEYMENLGYCPQSDQLNPSLTAKQTLSFIAKLRGLNDDEIVDVFLKVFELEKYADEQCGVYSGGNKRKLSLAVALMSYPKYVLLDEPTNGVDPSSRRKFWNLIKNVQEKKKLSFVLTSHSMTECEALCNYLKIMKKGEFVKEGTISDLKKEFGGFSIKLKLAKVTLDSDDKKLSGKCSTKVDSIEELKAYFISKYGAEVKDEHSGLLHFYIKDEKKTWSSLFKEIEGIKLKNEHLIEDYAISEASLEEIFLSVARSEDDTEESAQSNNELRNDSGPSSV